MLRCTVRITVIPPPHFHLHSMNLGIVSKVYVGTVQNPLPPPIERYLEAPQGYKRGKDPKPAKIPPHLLSLQTHP